jgi:anaerobic ribonucleoside-triphosphate reductase
MKTTIKENVKQLLIKYPQCRDNEHDLYYLYYRHICEINKDVDLLNFYYLRTMVKSVPSEQTLSRFSRQLQEQNPELRGKEWEKRQRKVKKVQK